MVSRLIAAHCDDLHGQPEFEVLDSGHVYSVQECGHHFHGLCRESSVWKSSESFDDGLLHYDCTRVFMLNDFVDFEFTGGGHQ